jgi:hypothetical protein
MIRAVEKPDSPYNVAFPERAFDERAEAGVQVVHEMFEPRAVPSNGEDYVVAWASPDIVEHSISIAVGFSLRTVRTSVKIAVPNDRFPDGWIIWIT